MEKFKSAQNRLLSAFNVTATSESIKLNWRDLNTHFLKTGAGEPVIFIHGGGCFASYWVPLIAQLDNFTIYAVDRPGFGLTDFIPYRKESIQEDAILFIENVFDKLGLDQPTVIANSMGSLWTFWFALERPERVKRMVHIGCPAMLLNSGGPLPLRALGIPFIGQIVRYFERPNQKNIQALFTAMNEEIITQEYPELFSTWLEAEQLPNFNKAWRLLLRSVFSLFGPREGVAITEDQLRQINHPVQLIWGENDPFGSIELGKRASHLMEKSNFKSVAGGHLPWLDAPKKTAAIITEFIDKTNSFNLSV